MEGQGFRDRAPAFEEQDAVILGVSFDPPEANRAFAEKLGFPFRLLSDEDRSVGRAYGTARPPDHERARWPRRFSYLIDPEGTVRKAYVVRDVQAHPDEVLKDLGELRTGADGSAR